MNSPFNFIKSLRATAMLAMLIAAFTVTALPQAGTSQTEAIDINSLIIAMDNDKQGQGSGCTNSEPFNLRAYGLAVRLLHSNIPLKWAISDSKAKNGSDFTANATRLTGANCQNGGTNTGFSGGPLIIDAADRTAALAIINTFNGEIGSGGSALTNDVRVYNVTASFVAPIRYTLTHKPLIAVGPDGGGFGDGIHQDLFERAKLRAANNSAYYANVNNENIQPNSCYTIATQAHAADSAINFIDDYRAFATAGGNLLLQCYSVDVFENNVANGRFLSTAGWTIFGTNPSSGDIDTTLTYPNPAIPFAQFNGLLGNQDGRVTEYQLNGGTLRPSTQIAAINAGSGNTSKIVAAVARIGSATAGGNVFELGGHDYSRTTGGGNNNTALGRANGERMLLNAVLTPAYRQGCGLSINSLQAFKTVAMAAGGDVNGDTLPNYGDTVEWTLRYINDGTSTISNFQVTDPLEAKLQYVAGSITATATAGSTVAVSSPGLYNGTTQINMLNAASSTIIPGGMITIKIRTKVQGFGTILNQGTGIGTNVPNAVKTDTADSGTTGNVAGYPIACTGVCLPQNQFQTGGNADPTGISLAAIPTSAPVTIRGAVYDTNGQGLSQVYITLQNASTGAIRNVVTNSFGRYTFANVPSGEFYILSANSKRYVFNPGSMTFNLVDELSNLNFNVGDAPPTRGVSKDAPVSTTKK